MAGRDPLTGGGVCERAHEWASLRLDGELSLLEEELLERHLEYCDECRGFDERMRSTTGLLRAAALETPSRPLRVATRRVREGAPRRRTAMIAAAALALGALVGSVVERPSEPVPAAPDPQFSLLMDFQQLRELPRTSRDAPSPEPTTPPNPPEGVI